jgi:hypothetical protein
MPEQSFSNFSKHVARGTSHLEKYENQRVEDTIRDNVWLALTKKGMSYVHNHISVVHTIPMQLDKIPETHQINNLNSENMSLTLYL